MIDVVCLVVLEQHRHIGRLKDGVKIGTITSGTLSPSVDRGIGMGYVLPAHAAPGTTLQVDIRGRERDAEVGPLPFYKKES